MLSGFISANHWCFMHIMVSWIWQGKSTFKCMRPELRNRKKYCWPSPKIYLNIYEIKAWSSLMKTDDSLIRPSARATTKWQGRAQWSEWYTYKIPIYRPLFSFEYRKILVIFVIFLPYIKRHRYIICTYAIFFLNWSRPLCQDYSSVSYCSIVGNKGIGLNISKKSYKHRGKGTLIKV